MSMTILTSFHPRTFLPRRSHNFLSEEMSGDVAVRLWKQLHSNVFYVLWPSLVSHVWVKHLKGLQRMSDVSAIRHHLVSRLWTVLSQIRVHVTFLTKPGFLVLPGNRLRLHDVTLSMSSLHVGLGSTPLNIYEMWLRPFWEEVVFRIKLLWIIPLVIFLLLH